MTNATKKPGGWSAVRQQLDTWEKPALLALLKDLYETAAENRDFIHARIQAGEGGGEALEKYRGKIVEQFFPARDSPTSMGTLTSGSTAAWNLRWTNWPPCCAARRGGCIHSSATGWREWSR